MTQTTYTQAAFGDLLNKALDGNLDWFQLTYPSDPRCPYRLWLKYRVKGSTAAYSTKYPDVVEDMRELLHDDSIISTTWYQQPDRYVTIVREEETCPANMNLQE